MENEIEQLKQENKRLLEIINAKPLETVDIDSAFKIAKLKEQLQAKEQECEELHNRTASIIYRLTGGRLSYSTYTLEGCEDAYTDQLRIDVERATKELSEENEILKSENFTFEELIKTQEDEMDKLKQALDEIAELCKNHPFCDCSCGQDVLDIINKAKE